MEIKVSDETAENHKNTDWATVEDNRTGLSVERLKRGFVDHLLYTQGKPRATADWSDYYMALAYAVRDRLMERWIATVRRQRRQDFRTVCYLSAEFLIGPQLEKNLLDLGIYDQAREAMAQLGLDLDDMIDEEPEPGLGNGGLGRLAACFMDSLATLQVPAIGYGIRYEFGIFAQSIENGWQVEHTDKWLQRGNPWEIARPGSAVEVRFGGGTEHYVDSNGRFRVRWTPSHTVKGVPYDTPILGYGNQTANTLRLWKAEATESFDYQRFNLGDYIGAVWEKMASETISKVLYPNDEEIQGKHLRLEQQYFFVACSLRDILNTHLYQGRPLRDFDKRWCIQLNDTHPSIGIAELMRLLVDDYLVDWEPAWEITREVFGYTNHTLLPEALERWPVSLFAALLPRHLEIIYEINHRFLEDVRSRFPGEDDRVARMSLIDETGERSIRMANLAAVGSHAVNGVAALHTNLLQSDVLGDFYQMYPERFSNKTNGVTPRRWLLLCNRPLSNLISERIGSGWITNLNELRGLEPLADDSGFREAWREVRKTVKSRLATYIKQSTGVTVDPQSLFDVQVKRLHEYKRQHLNLLHILTLYNRIKLGASGAIPPRTFIFGGKAAPGYFMAKLIIKLINAVGDVINNDPGVNGLLKVVFLPDFNVSLGQRIYPAADLSEQISTAGKEASGTGNMKFALNGALTIGTLDGANIEIREEVGAENFFLFGLTADEVRALKSQGYHPRDYYAANSELRLAFDQIASGMFSREQPNLFHPLTDSLLNADEYMLLADYAAYVACQEKVNEAWRDADHWTRMSILNTARMGEFSSDRTILEYCRDIWHAQPAL
jgi:starch phosphorylase